MKKYFNSTTAACLLFLAQPLLGFNDTIPSTKKVERAIPENFKDNYKSKDYIYEKSKPGWLLEFKEWLAQKLISFFEFINYNRGFHDLQILFYVLIAGIAIYIIAKILFHKEGTWVFRKKQNNDTLIYQDDVESIEVSNFELLIDKALQEDNFRLAVKLFYLWSLQKLAQKNFIELSNIKTNVDYQLELEETSFHQKFQDISYYYIYVWYGEFDVDKISFDKISSKYEQFLKEIAL